jgi:hypothetical protein
LEIPFSLYHEQYHDVIFMPEHVDLAVAWDWEYDEDFLAVLAEECTLRGLQFRQIGKNEIRPTVGAIREGRLHITSFLDRAAPDDEEFAALASAIATTSARQWNNPDAVRHAADKATMHLEFLSAGIDVPFTIIVSPYNQRREVGLTLSDLAHLGRPFIIKPANTTGGGIGVILGAETLKDVIDSRQHHKGDKYLLQEKIIPAERAGRRAWFRVFYICDRVIPCWWDDITHVYNSVDSGELDELGLSPLLSVTKTIGGITRLDFFSTEIALTPGGKFVAVDYVNEICDMRIKSTHWDGVPDVVVREICSELAARVGSITH